MIKRIAIVLLCITTTMSVFSQGGKALDLKEITSGIFRTEGIRGITPMADGEHYTQINQQGTQIIKYSFRTGEAVETVFDVSTARDCDFKNLDGYLF